MIRRDTSLRPADVPVAVTYIADMSGSLALMARGHGLDVIAYLLDMAHEEAETEATGKAAASGIHRAIAKVLK